MLVQLGQGAEVGRAQARCLRALAGREGVQVAATSSAIAGLRDVPQGVVHLHATYPISRYYAAFDAAVSAAGYNAFHELVRFRVPSLFVPMQRETDDQRARARYAEHAGVGVAADGPADPRLERRLEVLLDPDRRLAVRERLDELRPANGPADAAQWLQEVVAHPAAGTPGAPNRQRSSPALGPSLRMAAAWVSSLPRTVARLGRQWVSQSAFGLCRGTGVRAAAPRGVDEALRGIPDPPQRVLVVTDSLAIGSLRRAGVAVEHVPGPHSVRWRWGRRLRGLPAAPVGVDPRPSATPSARPCGWRGSRGPAGGGHSPPPPPR